MSVQGEDWPKWSIQAHPADLARYALPGVIASHLPVPGPSPESPIETVRLIYKILSHQHIRYSYEATFCPKDGQSIRSALEVLHSPRLGNCLDLALILGGACVHAGLQAMILLVESAKDKVPLHAVTCINIGRRASEGWPRSSEDATSQILVTEPPQGFLETIETQPGGPGEILVVEPNGLAYASSSSPMDNLALDFSEAIAAGAAYLRLPSWRWRLGITLVDHPEPYRPPTKMLPPTDGILRWRSFQRIQPQSLSALLREENMLVPFMGREDTLRRLMSWCREGAMLGTAVLTGPGGQGKSRLARELMHEMNQVNWRVGFLARDPNGRASLADITHPTKPTLVAIDYAETRATQVDALLEELEDSNLDSPLRLMLIARSTGSSTDTWWSGLDSYHHGLLGETHSVALEDIAFETGVRERMFREATSRFSRELAWMYPNEDWHGLPLYTRQPEAIRSLRYARPLTLQLEALVNLLGERQNAGSLASNRCDGVILENEFLRHERMYWMKVARSLDIRIRPQTLDAAMASLVLFGADTRNDAMRILSVASSSESLSESDLKRFDTAIRLIFPSVPVNTFDNQSGYWGTFEPDLLGEWHVGEVTRRNYGFVQTLASQVSDSQFQRGLEILRRTAQSYPYIDSLLSTLPARKRLSRSKHRATLTAAIPRTPPLMVEQAERVSMSRTIARAESRQSDDRGRLNSGQS